MIKVIPNFTNSMSNFMLCFILSCMDGYYGVNCTTPCPSDNYGKIAYPDVIVALKTVTIYMDVESHEVTLEFLNFC